MRDKRLDEAYDLAQDAGLREHRRGQDLIGRLARAFIERGRQHLAERRWPQASADCEKAAKLGGNLVEAAELHEAIREAIARQQKDDRFRAATIDAAKRQMDDGRLSMCAGILANLEADSEGATLLRHRVDAFRLEAEEHLDRARLAISAKRWDEAIDDLVAAKQRHVSNRMLLELSDQVVSAVLEEIEGALEAGRLDRADYLVRRLQPLAADTVALAEALGFLGQCRQTLAEVDRGRLRSAGEILCRLAVLRPEAEWIRDAHKAVTQAAQGLEELRGGPLGLRIEMSALRESRMMNEPSHDGQARRLGDTIRLRGGGRLPSQFVLHVDGAGSYLVARDCHVTIGPVSSSHSPVIGLAGGPGLPTVCVERNDEDYFLVSQQPVMVNGKQVTRKLLAHGDTIALSPRCRLKFMLPTAASTTAVLQLSGARLLSGDVRQIILLDRTLVMGPGASAHIRADMLNRSVALAVHDEHLVSKSDVEVRVDDQPLRRSEGIPLDVHVKIDGVTFVARKI